MNLSLRGIDAVLEKRLRDQANRSSMSLNATILLLLRKALGVDRSQEPHTDLDHLAGGWSEEDLKEFRSRTEDLEHIDQELWQ